MLTRAQALSLTIVALLVLGLAPSTPLITQADGVEAGAFDSATHDPLNPAHSLSSTAGITTRVSMASDGTQGNGSSDSSFISANGRYVTFGSGATNLVTGDTNYAWDVFVHDRETGQTTRVSVASDGTETNGGSVLSSITPNGRFVGFTSRASNLVDGDSNNKWDVFVHDRQTSETTLVAESENRYYPQIPYSSQPYLSSDGRFVAFPSDATDLVAGDTNNCLDIFIQDRQAGVINRVSVATDGTQGNKESRGPASISSDGRYVAFESSATNLVAGDTNGSMDVFVHDRQTGITTRVSVSSDGEQANTGCSLNANISADGRYITFESDATNLVEGDANGTRDVFVHDRHTGQTTIISVASDGTQGNASSFHSFISADARYVVFQSGADNLVEGDTNGHVDVFMHALHTRIITRVSVASDGTQGNDSAMSGNHPTISSDGRYVAFSSHASNLVSGDTNGEKDIFVRDRWQQPPLILVHGFQGFSSGRSCDDGVVRWYDDDGDDNDVKHSFGGMPKWFSGSGYDVWIANWDTGPGGTPPIEENAQCLRDQVAHVRQQTGRDVILVAHSMGGLVSRACLNLDDCRENVTALYTLGSPHAGINGVFLLKFLTWNTSIGTPICKLQPALCQLSTERMVLFNLLHPNRYDVDDYDFIGGDKWTLPWGPVLQGLDGPNDGLVGNHSAVGWSWPGKNKVTWGQKNGRYWTKETHTPIFAYPSYFEASGGPESQAFRCITLLLENDQPGTGDCTDATTQALGVTQAEPTLSATTVDVVGHIVSGQSVSHTLPVDTSDHSLFYLSWVTGTLAFSLTQSDGQVISPAYADTHSDLLTYTTSLGDGTTPPFAAYSFTTTVLGLYTVTITADNVGSEGTDYVTFAALETNRTFSVTTSADLYQASDIAIFTGTLQGPSGGIAGADVQVQLSRMDGVTETLALTDLGGGMYRTTYAVPDVPGYLKATFTAIGDDSGTAFTRQVDRLLAIAPHAAQLAGTYTDWLEDRDGDGFDDTLVLDVGVTATQVGTYTLSADLVASGQTVAHAVSFATLTNGTQTVTLRFDGWDIRRFQIDGPYTVTHVYLVDLGAGGIPAQIADDVWMTDAYNWQDFGFSSLYLPIILRNH